MNADQTPIPGPCSRCGVCETPDGTVTWGVLCRTCRTGGSPPRPLPSEQVQRGVRATRRADRPEVAA